MSLEIKKLSVGYGETEILSQLDLSLKPGDLVCLMGANGSGKSTLLRSLAGLQSSLMGEILIKDKPIEKFDPLSLAKEISLVLTDKPTLENLTVQEVVSLGRYPYLGFWGNLTGLDKSIVKKSLRTLALEGKESELFSKLSDGQKQKVFIARALAQETDVIILDEPTTFLDISHRMEVLSCLQALARDEGKSVLFTSHDWELVMQMDGEVWLIDNNKQLQQGTVEDLIINGSFERAFKTKDYFLDEVSGSFKRSIPAGEKFVSIVGNDPRRVRWTINFCQKMGIEVTASDSDVISVLENSWVYRGQSYQNLLSLRNDLV